MNIFLQPAEVDLGSLPNDEPFLSPADTEQWEKAALDAAEAKEQQKYDADERRRQVARDNARRVREQAEISGTLSGDAETFYELKLKPKLTEATEYEPQILVPVVQGVFNRDSLSWVAGPSGTFKSFVTADLAFRYGSEDMDYHGRKMTHGRALIVVAEGAAGYAHRKTAWEKEYDRQVKNVVIYPAPLQLGDTLKEMPALIHHLKEEEAAGRGYGLIIFDTQAMCTVGIDENKSEMNLVINVLHRIREVSKACVLTVHHFGKKESSGMRGSSMLYAAADTVLILKRKDDAMDVKLSTAQSDEGKQKDTGGEKDFLTLEMKFHEVGVDFFGDPVTSLVPIPGDNRSMDVAAPVDATIELPEVGDVDLYYLRGISTYQEDGSSPSGLRERLQSPDYIEKLPAPTHKVLPQTAGNRLQGLKGKGLTESVPGAKGKYRITPLGVAVIARHLIDRVQTETSWADRNRRTGRFKGRSTAGADHDQTLGSYGGSEGATNQEVEPN